MPFLCKQSSSPGIISFASTTMCKETSVPTVICSQCWMFAFSQQLILSFSCDLHTVAEPVSLVMAIIPSVRLQMFNFSKIFLRWRTFGLNMSAFCSLKSQNIVNIYVTVSFWSLSIRFVDCHGLRRAVLLKGMLPAAIRAVFRLACQLSYSSTAMYLCWSAITCKRSRVFRSALS